MAAIARLNLFKAKRSSTLRQYLLFLFWGKFYNRCHNTAPTPIQWRRPNNHQCIKKGNKYFDIEPTAINPFSALSYKTHEATVNQRYIRDKKSRH